MPTLYDFQRETVERLLNGKKIAVLGTGFGKTAIAMCWLRRKCTQSRKRNVLIVTTATKARSGDMEKEADLWNGELWRKTLDSFEVISWHKLKEWQTSHKGSLSSYVIVADEIQKIKGYTTGMGLAFRRIALANPDWSGYTATPGDRWIDIMPYFVASKLVKNKTEFLGKYCVVQTFKGFPEITAYLNQDKLLEMWRQITVIPDTTSASKELPAENNKIVEFKAPPKYQQVKKQSRTLEGDFIDSTMGLCHYLRQMCFTKEKQEWLKDFIDGLGTNCVFFCNYIEEEEKLCEIAKGVLPKEAKVWRIDGKHHEIPTAETIGKYDIVVAHYASGGEALNLQFMHYWVAVSPHYSFSTSVQAKGRIRRIGQKHAMFFYFLRTQGTIEEDIYGCLNGKKDFSEKVWANDNGMEYK